MTETESQLIALDGVSKRNRNVDLNSNNLFSNEVNLDLNRQTEREHVFRFFININATAFLVVALAASGMGLSYLISIVAWVYLILSGVLLINIIPSVTRLIDQSKWLEKTRMALSYLIYDFCLAFILLVNAQAQLSAPIKTSIIIVVMASFISLAVSPRSIFEFILGKIILFIAVAIVVVAYSDDNIVILFPVLLAFILVSVPAYWIYLIRLKVTNHRVEQQSLIKRLKNETEIRERLMVYIGHDLRQPINALGMLLHAMPQQNQSLAEAKECVRASKRLIGDIVQLADYQKELKPANSEFSIQSLFDAIKLEFNFVAHQVNCEIRCVDTKLKIINDQTLIGQILRNFVGNAITHANASTILIGVKRRKTALDLLVIDNGDGIRDHEKEAIFDEFVSGEHSIHKPGFGLGLTIAQHYADVCDAKILFQSKQGKGTLFGLSVPFRNASLS